MSKIIATAVLQVICIALTIIAILAESLGGAIGFGICSLYGIPVIVRYSIEYGEKKAWKKIEEVEKTIDNHPFV